MRLKTLSCLAALALAPAVGASSAAASPLAQGAAAKTAVPAGIQLAQADKLRGRRLFRWRGAGRARPEYRRRRWFRRPAAVVSTAAAVRGGDGVYRGGVLVADAVQHAVGRARARSEQ